MHTGIIKGRPSTHGDRYQLNTSTLIRHAARTYPEQEIVFRTPDGGWDRYTYADCYARIKKAANVLRGLGVGPADVVGILDWNSQRHFELYWAIPNLGARHAADEPAAIPRGPGLCRRSQRSVLGARRRVAAARGRGARSAIRPRCPGGSPSAPGGSAAGSSAPHADCARPSTHPTSRTSRDGQADPADRELLTAERHAALREAFSRLPPDGQQLIAMLIMDPPVPYAEISARLGIPVGSVGPKRRRCLDRLRRDPAISALI